MLQSLREIYGPIYAPILFAALRITGILILGYVMLRLIDSTLNRLRLIIPSSDTIGALRADVTAPHNQELEKVFDVLNRIGAQLSQDWPDRVLEKPIVLGIEKLDDTGITIRSIVKTPAFKNHDLLRDWRRRISDEFSRAGIRLTDKSKQEVKVIGQA